MATDPTDVVKEIEALAHQAKMDQITRAADTTATHDWQGNIDALRDIALREHERAFDEAAQYQERHQRVQELEQENARLKAEARKVVAAAERWDADVEKIIGRQPQTGIWLTELKRLINGD